MAKERLMLTVKTLFFALMVGLTFLGGIPYLVLKITPDILSYEIGFFRWVGILPILLGIALFLYTMYSLVYFGQGTPAPFDPPKRLVVSGPYKRVRNPGYLGAITILVGESIVAQSYSILIYALTLWAFFHLFVILYEEPGLRKRFGTVYDEYFQAVPRWIPRLRDRPSIAHH